MSAEPEDDVIERIGSAIYYALAPARRYTWDELFSRERYRAVARAALSASGLLERERVLREALEPFGKAADLIEDGDFYSGDPNGLSRASRSLDRADFRRARTALSNL